LCQFEKLFLALQSYQVCRRNRVQYGINIIPFIRANYVWTSGFKTLTGVFYFFLMVCILLLEGVKLSSCLMGRQVRYLSRIICLWLFMLSSFSECCHGSVECCPSLLNILFVQSIIHWVTYLVIIYMNTVCVIFSSTCGTSHDMSFEHYWNSKKLPKALWT